MAREIEPAASGAASSAPAPTRSGITPRSLLALRLRLEYPVRLPRGQIAYFPVPKNACTSLKRTLYRLRFGHDFANMQLGARPLVHMHNVFPSRPLRPGIEERLAGWQRFAIVREPIARFVSCYCNRVLHYRDLARHRRQLARFGLSDVPSIIDFVLNLERYRAVSRLIRHHTDPQVIYLGANPALFTRIFHVREIAGCASWLEERLGMQVRIPRMQEGGGEHRDEAARKLGPEHRRMLSDFYREDIDAYSRHFE